MMRKPILTVFAIFSLQLVFGQTYLINTYNGQTVSTCSGKIYDSGGASGGYGNNENYTMTICSNNTTNTHIKLYFWQFGITANDTLFIYDGNSTAAPLIGTYNDNNSLFLFPVYATAANASGCITLRFKSDGSGAGSGFEAEISCVIACQTVIAGLDSVAMVQWMGDSNYIDICLGDTITFTGNGIFPQNNIIYPQSNSTCTFSWDFGDGTTATGQVVQHFYPLMRGYNVELRITDDRGCVSMNALGTRVRISDDPIGKVASLPDICSGSELTVSVGYSSLNNINVTIPQFYQSASLKYDSATFIPDGGAFGGQCYNTYVTFNCFNPGQTVVAASNINSVVVNMEHSFVGDLEMKLICPNGQQTIVKTYIQSGGAYLGVPFGGANHANFDCVSPPGPPGCELDPTQNPPGAGWTYSWTMNSPIYGIMNNYSGGAQVDSGSYTPDNGFGSLIGCPLNGTWNFQVCDYWGIDNGWVFWWELNLDASILPINWGYSVPIDTVQWTGPFITSQTSSHMTIQPNVGGLYNYNVTITDEFGCAYDTTVPINVVQTPDINLGKDTSMCEGTPFILSAPSLPGSRYLWLPTGDTTQSIPVTQSGQYTVVGQTTNGIIQCIGYDTINVNFFPEPLISFIPDIFEGCNPVEVFFNNVSQPKTARYDWDFGDGGIDSIYAPTHLYNSAGVFDVTLHATTGEGCTRSFTINDLIRVNPQPTAAFVMSDSLLRIGSPTVNFNNQSLNGTLYQWDFGDGDTSAAMNPSHSYTHIGKYDITLITYTEDGCADTITKTVFIIDDLLEIPNVITPGDGNGKNDKFVIKNLESYTTNQIVIFDRWGRKVFDQINYQNDWDGDNLPTGTYYFTLKARGMLQNVSYKGVVTILRN